MEYIIQLDLVHGIYITGLHVILELFDFLREFIHRDQIVHDSAHHLQLLDSVSNRDKFAGPQVRPSISMLFTDSNILSMSVSSSQGFTSRRTEVLAITWGFFAFFSW